MMNYEHMGCEVIDHRQLLRMTINGEIYFNLRIEH
jgi:hypothetical protein